MQENKPGAKAKQITQSTSAEFNSYAWREPDLISFKNRYGADVYARLYVPAKPHPDKPAVVFVHGAGYLQNVHYWWSQYFREFMFNNLLTDAGYTVLDIDYTVFGETISGLQVIDKIAAMKTDGSNRPLVNVMMKMEIVKNVKKEKYLKHLQLIGGYKIQLKLQEPLGI